MQSQIDQAVATLGRPLLEFVCARPLEEIAANESARSLVSTINSVLATVTGPNQDPNIMRSYLKYRLSEEVDGEVLAVTLHKQAGGVVSLPNTDDQLDELVVRIAAECYPFLLLPIDPFFAAFQGDRLDSLVSSLLIRHHLSVEFRSQLLTDQSLAAVFNNHSTTSGHTTDMIYRSTGRGSSLQLWTLLDLVMSGAWRARPTRDTPPGISVFCELALERWRLIRRLLPTKQRVTVSAYLAFAGVRLPSTGPYTFGDFIVRQPNEQDTDRIPKSLPGQLTMTTSAGNEISIEYSGDIVAEAQVPYMSLFRRESVESIPEWPTELRKANRIVELGEQLRVSLLLSIVREQRVQIVPSWQAIDDPLEHAITQQWSDPRHAMGLVPTILTEEEVSRWQDWFGYVTSPGSEKRFDSRGPWGGGYYADSASKSCYARSPGVRLRPCNAAAIGKRENY